MSARLTDRSHGRKPAPAGSHADESWLGARRVARELDKIIDGQGPRRIAVERASAELRLTTRQVYNLLARYRDGRRVTLLLRAGDGTRKKRLQEAVETIIVATLRERWLVQEGPPLATAVAEIRARCEEANLAPPSYPAIARRIYVLFSPEEIAKKRSANPKHLHRLKPRPGYIHAARPLEVCQIDHTPTDINFVEVVEGGGTFVGRAFLTILIDVATR